MNTSQKIERRRSWPASIRYVAALCLIGHTGCASHDASPPSEAEQVVSFGSDVVPLFKRGCAVGGRGCHGDAKVAGDGRPDLGAAVAATIRAELVGVPSQENPAMALVSPGDPSGSFLMRKMDGDQAKLAAECASSPLAAMYPNCGDGMPQGYGMPLPEADRATVRTWITEGAPNN